MTDEERKSYLREYYKINRKQLLDYHRIYYKINRQRCMEQHAELLRRNREQYKEAQAWIRPAREALGLNRRQLGELIGVTRSAIYHYEEGLSPAPEKLREVLKEVEK